MISADEIRAANERIKRRAELVVTTSLDPRPALSALTGCRVLLKNEHFQRTGSFKLRGATNRLSLLSDDERRRGVVVASSGNHGLAFKARTSADHPNTVEAGGLEARWRQVP